MIQIFTCMIHASSKNSPVIWAELYQKNGTLLMGGYVVIVGFVFRLFRGCWRIRVSMLDFSHL